MGDQRLDSLMAIAQAMADELTDYLLGGQVYRQLVVKTPMGTRQPKMTLGSMLETVGELSWRRAELTPEQQKQLADIQRQMSTAKGAFRLQWYELLQSELRGLLSSWRWYLDEAGRSKKARRDYPSEVWIRTRIDVIQHELADDPAIRGDLGLLGDLDARLRGMMQPGGYVGPQGEERRYPARDAWWLYGTPASLDD